VLKILALPGHSHGHLGIYDVKHGALYYGDAIQGQGYKTLEGTPAFGPTYMYVDAYLKTIRDIENLGADIRAGCHWPVCRGTREIRQFCSVSRRFVEFADQEIRRYIEGHPSGTSLRELCDGIGSSLGDWPAGTNRELCYAFLGHLERSVERGHISRDDSVRPVLYRPILRSAQREGEEQRDDEARIGGPRSE
jgi:hypothetical protein